MRPLFAVAVAALLAVAVPALAQQGLTNQIPTRLGTVLADPNGNRTLYNFDGDAPGAAMCIGDCNVRFPAFLAAANATAAGDYSLIARADGSKQWAYKGRALYRFYLDASFGDTAGDGIDGKWHAVKP